MLKCCRSWQPCCPRAEAARAQEGQAAPTKERKPRVPLSDEATLAQLADVQGGCCVCILRCAPLCAGS